ncbi:MAG: reverse transcriptase domain-containing protein [Candidatus Woesearchaeota archaeon]
MINYNRDRNESVVGLRKRALPKQLGLLVRRASWLNNFNNNSNFNANNHNINNNNSLRGIFRRAETFILTDDLWGQLCSKKNLELAFKAARKHKTLKSYVIEFESDLKNNLSLLRTELLFHFYQPRPLETFILRDPKTRKISKAHFRDRVIHHALCNVIEPLFEKRFIYDSYANRIGKGAFKAIERFEHFSKEITRNHALPAYVLKADIRHYFETVDHDILLQVLKSKIKDARIIWLIEKILKNHSSEKGMPLGNLTSQFFANVYLNELDQFVKHELKAKYYLRYVDDFVILHHSKTILEEWKSKIDSFLYNHLALELHPDKSRIIPLENGVDFLGFKVFSHHRLIKRRNRRKFQRTLRENSSLFESKQIEYDELYDFMEGWVAYTKHADTYNLRIKILVKYEEKFSHEISSKEISRGISLLLHFPPITFIKIPSF